MLKIKITKIATIVLTLVILLSTMVNGTENFRPNIDFDIGSGRQNAIKIASSQVYNILYTVKTNVGNIQYLKWISSYNPPNVELFTYRPGLDIVPADVKQYGAYTIYSCSTSGGLGSGKFVYEERYNAPSTVSVATAKSNISYDFIQAKDTNGNLLDSSCVTLSLTLMGDINNDNEINSSDALLALQASTQSITLTPAQALAADVDRNGAVSAVDSMLILQYTTAKIASFWGKDTIAPIPTTANANIVDGRIYRIGNVYSGKFMKATGSIANSAVKQYTYVKTNTAFKFKFQYMGSGEYKIIPQNATSMVLSINTDGNFVLDTDTSVASKRWYVASYGSGYYIINKSSTSEFLSVESVTGTDTSIVNSINVSGSIWKLNNASVTINNYYDYGYNVRYSTFPSNYIKDCQNDINDAYIAIFGASVTSNTPSLITSYADKCYTDYGQVVTSDNISAWCTHATDVQCQNDTSPNHHKSILNMLTYFKASYGSSSGGYICTLSTGHSVCDIRINLETGLTEHGRHYSGMANQFRNVVSVCVPDDSGADFPRRVLSVNVMMHEQSHNFGAGGNADTNHGLTCVMSYNRNRNQIYEDIFDGEYTEIYCDACKNAIINGLKYF